MNKRSSEEEVLLLQCMVQKKKIKEWENRVQDRRKVVVRDAIVGVGVEQGCTIGNEVACAFSNGNWAGWLV